MAITYHALQDNIARDMTIPRPAKELYLLLLSLSNINSGVVLPILVGKISEMYHRSVRTTQRWLAYLHEIGLVERIFCKNKANPRWNNASYFIVHGTDAERYANSTDMCENAVDNSNSQRLTPPSDTQRHPKYKKEHLRNKILTINRDNELPENSDISEKLSQTSGVTPTVTDATNEKTQKPLNQSGECGSVCTPTQAAQVRTAVSEKPQNQSNQSKAQTLNNQTSQSVEYTSQDSEYDLSGVPEMLRHVARYLLLRTKRTRLTDNELCVLREILNKRHTPTRIIKEIDKQIILFKRRGKNLRQLTFNYIGEILRYQQSREQSQEKKTEQKRTVYEKSEKEIRAENALSKVKCEIMPTKDAEKVISDCTADMKKQSNPAMPAALLEFWERLNEKSSRAYNDYLDRYAIWLDLPLDERDEYPPECKPIEYNEYLQLLYPDVSPDKLDADRIRDWSGFQQAYDIDMTCAHCKNPDECPHNRKSGRPFVSLEKNGTFCVRYSINTPCKHVCASKPSPEFEQKIKKSGLSNWQIKQTFESFNHDGVNAEILSAKAKAMLAAKNNKSLIIAGKSGAGKTHLAISIALSAISRGKTALFRTAPELLDELARADWEHTDFFGLRQKFYDTDCLVIDDLGKEKLTPKKIEYLYQIIDYRYRHGRQTIATTNAQNMAELVSEYNADVIEPIISRILSNGDLAVITETENYRLIEC